MDDLLQDEWPRVEILEARKWPVFVNAATGFLFDEGYEVTKEFFKYRVLPDYSHGHRSSL